MQKIYFFPDQMYSFKIYLNTMYRDSLVRTVFFIILPQSGHHHSSEQVGSIQHYIMYQNNRLFRKIASSFSILPTQYTRYKYYYYLRLVHIYSCSCDLKALWAQVPCQSKQQRQIDLIQECTVYIFILEICTTQGLFIPSYLHIFGCNILNTI